MILTLGLLLIFLAGCTNTGTDGRGADASVVDWKDITLKDVRTGENFRISEFKGKPVLIESFAVWCPTCLEQQKKTKELKIQEGDAIIHISLDTDPNEDEESIREHIETNGFDWYFAISPIELTTALIEEFSQQIVFAPGAPVILVCEDQSARLLRRGVKPAEELLQEIKKGC